MIASDTNTLRATTTRTQSCPRRLDPRMSMAISRSRCPSRAPPFSAWVGVATSWLRRRTRAALLARATTSTTCFRMDRSLPRRHLSWHIVDGKVTSHIPEFSCPKVAERWKPVDRDPCQALNCAAVERRTDLVQPERRSVDTTNETITALHTISKSSWLKAMQRDRS